MNSSTADDFGYSVYYDEMAKFLSQKNLPSSELEIIIQNMWNSIDQLQKKIYHDKAKKVSQQPAEKSQSPSTRVTRRSARLRKTENADKNENIDSEDSTEKTDSDEEVNGHEVNDSSSPEDDTPLIHLKDDSPPPKIPKKEEPRAEELRETEPKVRPEVKLKTEVNDLVNSTDQTQKRKSPSPSNKTVQNGEEKITDANSNQEKQVSTTYPLPIARFSRQNFCRARFSRWVSSF